MADKVDWPTDVVGKQNGLTNSGVDFQYPYMLAGKQLEKTISA
jgi:hypothetical protein